MGSKKQATSLSLVAIGVVLVLLGSAYLQQTDALLVINLSSAPVNVSVSLNGISLGSVLAGANLNVSLPLLKATAIVDLTLSNLLTNVTVTIPAVSININSALLITPALLAPPASSPPPPLPGLPGLPPVPVVPLINSVTVLLGNLLGGVFQFVRTLVSAL